MKLTTDQRTELIDKLCADWYEAMRNDFSWAWALAKNGHKGFYNYTDEELLQAHRDAFDEDYLEPTWKVERDGKYLYIECDGRPGRIQVKAEDEGFVVDVYPQDECLVSAATLAIEYTELEDQHEA